ncbi:HPr family phosphocarrier protein [Mesorhizobium sp. BAC0120]|uniref:HPr family phosphocarrier protein n=1 Tax=Mesorhizobium sp. BAC0120 TaxID=3090670 RepID=UPI00298C50EB|nr:HPr family phosphocarrier protein [Mesorhizobium sp. BAC0120]MDW6024522.1 HPr family phosphocarrier protein [Mesorhizobium sp. BAC0120]
MGAPLVREFEIVNQRGLHARASAKFVQLVSGFQAEVRVEKDGVSVGGTSIMGLMMLAASPGCCIRVTADGPEAEEVMTALEKLISSRFGEEI